ncbi:hypothetical protein FNV43_RR21916 [Rhamnella rubrinervis]|uniref:Uncharacterized protein n=1 Tax=Rhamnella rubrinervis TaxID=2594499 RepID=A0A8K0GQK3_9ROSA|nr:hypothetical protein FNV43_RR21916 [Rhamnella rubrinervis]
MTSYHVRSNSLPSRPHPIIPKFDEQLCRLRTSEATSSLASTSISSKLNGLQDLLDCVDGLLLLPLNQQALSEEKHQKWVDQTLDGSLRLLDVCNIAKDALLQTKESTQELQSVIRRRRSGVTELPSEVKKFLTSRKLVKKTIQKAIIDLKAVEISPFNKDNETTAIISMLRELQAITHAIFKSLLSFISGPKSQSKSFFSTIMRPNRIEEESQLNEFTRIDASLNLFVGQKMKKSDDFLVENAQNLEELASCIQDIEGGLESLFRRLIKTRVSLLNILSH